MFKKSDPIIITTDIKNYGDGHLIEISEEIAKLIEINENDLFQIEIRKIEKELSNKID